MTTRCCESCCRWCGQHEVTASLLDAHEAECVARPVMGVA